MYRDHIKSLFEERFWLFQLRYSPFYSEWLIPLLPVAWLIMIPIWLLTIVPVFLEDKNSIVKILFFSITLFFVGAIVYLYVILGDPNQKKWEKEIFPRHVAQILTKVYDSDANMIGGIANTKLAATNKGTFYVENIPSLYWNILKFREEFYLDFNNDQTGIGGIYANPRSFNGIDPMGIPNAISKGRGGSSLSQQLVKNFYGQDYFRCQTSFHLFNTILRKWKELDESKTFYHNLRQNDGEEFKRWIAMYPPSLVSNGSVYGIESVSAVIFGKKPKDLSESEQIILSEMYKYTYYFSGKVNKSKCELIKKGAKLDIENYFNYKQQEHKIEALTHEIDNWTCPTEPRVPFGFYQDLQEQDAQGRAIIGNPKNRIWEWASTSASTLRSELDTYRKEHNNSLITEAKMTVDVPDNIEFKDGINNALANIESHLGNHLYVNLDGDKADNRPQANIWISVVDEHGEIKYIYKRGNTASLRRIGSISKVFEAIALGNRGDKWDYYYCNEPFDGLHNSDGSRGGACYDNSNNNIYEARKVFGASKNLPLKSALEKYVVKNNKGIKIIEDKISHEKLAQIYQAFNLKRDHNTSMRYELSFGLVNATPLGLQKSIHKLTHLLYYKGTYKEAHITKSIKYKILKDFQIQEGKTIHKLYARDMLTNTRDMFDNKTKIYMRTVLKSALNPYYGTLRSFNAISNFKTMFMKSGTTDKVVEGERLTQGKWVAGAIKVKGKPYSFVIMVHNENGIGKQVGHNEVSKILFNEIVKSLNQKRI